MPSGKFALKPIAAVLIAVTLILSAAPRLSAAPLRQDAGTLEACGEVEPLLTPLSALDAEVVETEEGYAKAYFYRNEITGQSFRIVVTGAARVDGTIAPEPSQLAVEAYEQEANLCLEARDEPLEGDDGAIDIPFVDLFIAAVTDAVGIDFSELTAGRQETALADLLAEYGADPESVREDALARSDEAIRAAIDEGRLSDQLAEPLYEDVSAMIEALLYAEYVPGQLGEGGEIETTTVEIEFLDAERFGEEPYVLHMVVDPCIYKQSARSYSVLAAKTIEATVSVSQGEVSATLRLNQNVLWSPIIPAGTSKPLGRWTANILTIVGRQGPTSDTPRNCYTVRNAWGMNFN